MTSLEVRSSLEDRLQKALGNEYRVERELGRGGMGIVFLAYEVALDRQVAIKVLPPERATDDRRRRFRKEALAAARLAHPGIVPVYTVSKPGGDLAYFTMRYIRGGTLADRISRLGRLPVDEVTRILRDAAWALHHAHTRGVIHRDLKPHNILLEEDGRGGPPAVFVSDFGLATVDGEERSGRPPIGTLPYASPERLAGSRGDVRSDIYALGVTGYVALTGTTPYRGTAEQIVKYHETEPVPALEVKGAFQDTTLSRVLARCLERNPRKRYQDAEALADGLTEAAALRRELATPLVDFLGQVRRISPWTDVLQLLAVLSSLKLFTAFGVPDVLQFALGSASGQLFVCAGILLFVSVSPLVAIAPIARRLFELGYRRDDIITALDEDLYRQRAALAYRTGRKLPRTGPAGWRALGAGLAAWVLGLALLSTGWDGGRTGERIRATLTAGGALLALGAMLYLVWDHSRRGKPAGGRWLWFWSRWPGKWMERLVRYGMAPVEPQDPEVPGVIQLIHQARARISAWLVASPSPSEDQDSDDPMRRLVLEHQDSLETILPRLVESRRQDARVTRDLQSARRICEEVWRLLEGSGSR